MVSPWTQYATACSPGYVVQLTDTHHAFKVLINLPQSAPPFAFVREPSPDHFSQEREGMSQGFLGSPWANFVQSPAEEGVMRIQMPAYTLESRRVKKKFTE